jgi:altronate hydrolase
MSQISAVATEPRSIRLSPSDNVVVAVDEIEKGKLAAGGIAANARITRGHKMAVTPIAAGQPILKFGQIIGFATEEIVPGDWVHEHNTSMGEFERDYAFAAGARNDEILPVEQRATFQGYRRANGKSGTRNYIGILTSVNCSASVARFMAEAVTAPASSQYPNIDGIIPSSMAPAAAWRRRAKASIPQAHAMGLCHQSQHGRRADGGTGLRGLPDSALQGAYNGRERPFRTMTIQETGGTARR